MARGRPSKKAIILDIAESIFAERGYQGTSIDLVVKEAAVSKPTVYNNFPSKQALLQQLISNKIESVALAHSTIVSDELNYHQKIYNVFHSVITSPFELSIYKMYLGESYKLSNESLELCEQYETLLMSTITTILTRESVSDTVHFAIISIYKNGILINALSKTNIPSANELKALCQVLEKL